MKKWWIIHNLKENKAMNLSTGTEQKLAGNIKLTSNYGGCRPIQNTQNKNSQLRTFSLMYRIIKLSCWKLIKPALGTFFTSKPHRTISRNLRIISRIFELSTGFAETPIFTAFKAVFHKNSTEKFIAGRARKAPHRAEFRERKNIKYI